MCLRRTEDTFAYYMVEEFAAGFRKRLFLQLRGIKQNRGRHASASGSPNGNLAADVMTFMGSSFKKTMAFQPRGIKQSRCSSGNGIWITKSGSSCTSPDMLPFTDAKGTWCRVAYITVEELASGFKKTSAFQLRGIKQTTGSSGEGDWIIQRKPGNHCESYKEGRGPDDEVFDLMTLTRFPAVSEYVSDALSM